jgi:hypothetical protein
MNFFLNIQNTFLMNSITITTTVRTNEPISHAAISEIVRGIRQGLQLSVESSGGIAPPVQATEHEKKKLTVALEC